MTALLQTFAEHVRQRDLVSISRDEIDLGRITSCQVDTNDTKVHGRYFERLALS